MPARTATLAVLTLALAACLLATSCEIFSKNKLQDKVVDALAADSRTSQYKFEVSATKDGKVTITGEIYSDVDKEAVTEVAKAVEGVTQVINNCAMEEPGSDMMQDTVVPGGFM